MRIDHIRLISLLPLIAAGCCAATFGTVVPVRGTPADIALDEQRGRLYVANLASYRVDVLNTEDLTFGAALNVAKPPTSVALSPNNRFLVVGFYEPYSASTGGLAVFDLEANTKQEFVFEESILAVSFGANENAFVVTTKRFLLFDPVSGMTQTIGLVDLAGQPLPVAFGTFPPEIVRATTGVSGDGKTIVVMAETTWPPSSPAAETAILQYRADEAFVRLLRRTTTPALGPRAVSVNQDGSAFVAGWVLMDRSGRNHAQFPYVTGNLRTGGHAFDFSTNRIYADVPVPAGEEKVLHVMATDNLTVEERIQLPQAMAGRSLFSSDMKTLWAISDGGIMKLPVGALSKERRVAAREEDLLFLGDACNRRVISQSIQIRDLGDETRATDFRLSLPANTTGIRLLQSSGVTPATVQIEVDPTAYQHAKGTTTVMLTLESSKGVGIPFPVRLLINTRDFDQRGQLVNVPGKLVDVMADRSRQRLYLLRQDKNQVVVYDNSTLRKIDAPGLRTGNTPVGMAISSDGKYMIVGNDNSQYASVFDLETMQPSEPIWFSGYYPRMIAVSNGGIWATARSGGGPEALFRVDFDRRTANAPSSLGIYCNGAVNDCSDDPFSQSALASTPSGNYVLLATPGGAVALWEAASDRWVISRKDLGPVSGAFGALSDYRFVVGDNLLDEALYPIAKLESATGDSSGTAMAGELGLRTTVKAAAAPGTLQRIDLSYENLQPFHGTAVIESPLTAETLVTPRIGQVGQTVIPFTRTLTVMENQSPILLGQSGISVIAPDFDAPTAIPTIGRVANLADGTTAVAPGGLVSISGTGLAAKFTQADSLPLPTTLGEACVTVNNVPLPLFRVSPTEFAAQLPFTVSGDAQVVVRSAGGISSPYPVRVQNFAPAIFRSGEAGDETGLATVVRQKNNELVNFTNPIHPEEMISIYLTGMARTSPEAPLGDASPADPVAMVNTPPVVTIGGVPLALAFAGLTPGSVGIYQINAWVPGAVRGASQAPLVVMQGQASTTLQVRVVTP